MEHGIGIAGYPAPSSISLLQCISFLTNITRCSPLDVLDILLMLPMPFGQQTTQGLVVVWYAQFQISLNKSATIILEFHQV
jgi:hypothetical protein